MPRQLKLMADYHCTPVWGTGADVGPVPLEELPISGELRRALLAWAKAYDATLNDEYPADSGFASPEAADAFETEGRRLWQALREELGEAYEVLYFSEQDGLQGG
jgi:hypothetical protein